MLYTFGEYRLDLARRELRRGTEPVAIEPQVFDLLGYLVRHRDRVVGKDDLLAAIWGGRIVSDSALTTRINAVRRAVGDSGEKQRLIRTYQRKGFRFVAELHEPPGEESSPPQLSGPGDTPSVAVLPFTNLSGDPAQAHLGDGTVEQIAAGFGRIGWLAVTMGGSVPGGYGPSVDMRQVGRELSARYLLAGSVRQVGERLRITTRLIEAESRAQLWTDWCDGTLGELFELQEAVATKAAASVEAAIETAETARALYKPSDDLGPRDLYFRALPGCYRYDAGPLLQARDLLDLAVERDPGFGPALAAAAGCRQFLDATGWAAEPETNRLEAVALTHRALQADGDDPSVLTEAARVLGYFTEDIDSAVAMVERALVLNPSHARGWYWSGWIRLFAGEPDRAIEDFQNALRLAPLQRPYMTGIGAAHFFGGRYSDAVEVLVTASHAQPGWPTTHRFLAAAYAQIGNIEKAREVARNRLRIIAPALAATPEWLATSVFRNPEQSALYVEGLRAAAGTA
jgi:TolB-like protein